MRKMDQTEGRQVQLDMGRVPADQVPHDVGLLEGVSYKSFFIVPRINVLMGSNLHHAQRVATSVGVHLPPNSRATGVASPDMPNQGSHRVSAWEYNVAGRRL